MNLIVSAGILMILVVIGLVVMLLQFVTRNSLAAWLTIMITSVLFTGAMLLFSKAGAGNGHQFSESGLTALQWAGMTVFLIASVRRFASRFMKWRGNQSE